MLADLRRLARQHGARRWILLLLLAVVLGGTLEVVRRDDEAQAEGQRRLQVQNALGEVDGGAAPAPAIEALLQSLERRVARAASGPAELRRQLAHLQRRLPGAFSLLIFDPVGAVTADSDPSVPRTLCRRFYIDWLAVLAGAAPSETMRSAFSRRYLGPWFPPAMVGPGRLMTTGRGGVVRAVYMSQTYRWGAFLIRVLPTMDWETLGVRLALARARRRSVPVRLVVAHRAVPAASVAVRLGLAAAAAPWLTELEDDPLGTSTRGSAVLGRRDLTRDLVAWGLLADPAASVAGDDGRPIRAGVAVWPWLAAALVLTVGLIPPLVRRWGWTWSVRRMLVVSLSIGAAVPVLIIAATTGRLLRERELALIANGHRRSDELLTAWDRGFDSYTRRLGQRCARELAGLDLARIGPAPARSDGPVARRKTGVSRRHRGGNGALSPVVPDPADETTLTRARLAALIRWLRHRRAAFDWDALRVLDDEGRLRYQDIASASFYRPPPHGPFMQKMFTRLIRMYREDGGIRIAVTDAGRVVGTAGASVSRRVETLRLGMPDGPQSERPVSDDERGWADVGAADPALNMARLMTSAMNLHGGLSRHEIGDLVVLLKLQPVAAAGHSVGAVWLAWSPERLQRAYLRETMLAVQRRLEHAHVIALPRQGAVELPATDPATRRVLRDFARALGGDTFTRREMVTRGEQRWLLTGTVGHRLSHFRVAVAMHDLPIVADLKAWRDFLLLAVTAMVIVFIGAVISLAHLLVTPLASLSMGVAALAARRFDARVEVSGDHDLARLAAMFNEMLVGLADLELAGALQDQLFPREPLRQGGWQVSGLCLSAQAVGGDTFTYFPLDRRRVLLMIGDVSGHGIGAGLVAAMVRAVLAHPATGADLAAAGADPPAADSHPARPDGGPRFAAEPPPTPAGGDSRPDRHGAVAHDGRQCPVAATVPAPADAASGPVAVLETLHRVLFTVMRRRRMMTCLVGVLETDTGRLELASAGHAWPLLIGAGVARFLPLAGWPLGSRRDLRLTSQVVELRPADVLVAFTDGLVETPTGLGPRIGYDRLQSEFPSLVGGSASATLAAMRQWFVRVSAGRSPLDDVTLLVAQGGPGAESPASAGSRAITGRFSLSGPMRAIGGSP